MHSKRTLIAAAAGLLLLAPPAFAAGDTDAADQLPRSGLGSEMDEPRTDPRHGMPQPDTLPPRSGLGSEADRVGDTGFRPVEHMEVQRSGDVTYIMGGVDPLQREKLKQMGGDYNLELALPSQRGEYFGGGALEIRDQRGRTVLTTQVDAPLLLAKLPPGNYSVQLSADGETTTRAVTIGTEGRQELAMSWPGHTGIEAGDAPADQQ
jgi:hypothetical protein